MKASQDLPILIEGFFTKRLIAQSRLSPRTIESYRDAFRLLLRFAEERIGRPPCELAMQDLSVPLIAAFLDHLETKRGNSPRSRNIRLAAIRSFFRYASIEAPEHSALVQRVMAIPRKRHNRRLIDYLERPEIDALLTNIDRTTWVGQRDHAFLLTAVQTGLRLAELTGLRQGDVVLGTGSHVRCEGKGRKERCTPLTKSTVAVLRTWMIERAERTNTDFVFPSLRGSRLSSDAGQHLVRKHIMVASKRCPSLHRKRVTPHVLRHTAAMELLQSGVDRSLIAIWLGHESVETTQVYLDANLALKREILAKTRSSPTSLLKYKPGDRLLHFLKTL